MPCSCYPKAMRFKVVVRETNNVSIYKVSIKHALGTVDCGLRTADCGLWTTDYGLRTGCKTRT